MKLNRFAILIRMDELGIRFQQDLADKAGISRVCLCAGMNGKTVSGQTVDKIAAALNTDVNSIIVKRDLAELAKS